MGVKGLWTDALGLLDESESLITSKIAEMHPNRRIQLAVDVSLWLNKYCVTDDKRWLLHLPLRS
jgi:hypothetical protein